MAQSWRYERKTGRVPWEMENAKLHRLFEFAASLVQIHDQLSPSARKRLVGRLQDGLKTDVGLAPLRFELQVAMHAAMAGFEFDCSDLESGGGFDLLVRRNTVEVEIECKTFSADLGRCVHKRRLYELGHAVIDHMVHALKEHRSLFVDVRVDQHLTGRILEQVVEEIESALFAKANRVRDSICSIMITPILEDEIPPALKMDRPDEESVQQFVEQRFQVVNASTLVAGDSRGLLIVSIRGTKPDRLADAMYRELKKGTKQLSGKRPGIIRAHLLDTTSAELLSLHRSQEAGQPSLLNAIVTRLFSDKRPHLFGVSFSAPGAVFAQQRDVGRARHTITREESPSYSFPNEKHQLATNQTLRDIL